MNDLVQPTPTPTAVATVDASPAALLVLAVERQAPLDYIERLLALKRETDKDAARNAYAEAMAAFKAESIQIIKSKAVGYKTKEGDFVSYKHADLADVVDAVVPAMGRHGLYHRWDIRQENGAIHVDCVVFHRAGHSERVTMFAPPDNSGKKNTIQQIASTKTYLERYTLLSITGLATRGEDDDGNGGSDNSDGGGSNNKSPDPAANKQGTQQTAQLPAYPSEKFDQNLPEWAALIHTGEKTAERIIAFIEKKASLTPEQKKKLTDLEPKQ